MRSQGELPKEQCVTARHFCGEYVQAMRTGTKLEVKKKLAQKNISDFPLLEGLRIAMDQLLAAGGEADALSGPCKEANECLKQATFNFMQLCRSPRAAAKRLGLFVTEERVPAPIQTITIKGQCYRS